MPYSELYCHLVWATKGRAPLLIGDRLVLAERAIRATCREHGAVPHAVGLMPDHVHLAVSFPPSLAISDLTRLVKGGASHLLNHGPIANPAEPFAWQPEYGALSFGKRSLSSVVAYIVNQPTHHAANDLWPTFERTESIAPNSARQSTSQDDH